MNFLKRLFGGGNAAPVDDNALHLYVRCGRCSTPIHVRIDTRNDLMPEYGDDDDASGYRLVKEIMDSRCFRLIRAEITFDRRRREVERSIEGGTFITKEEYDTLKAQETETPKR
jgi:hypothetical protein